MTDKTATKKALFISYYFPPIGGGGVLRVAKFVKYLSRFNYQPYVLTVKKGFYPVQDKGLLSELPQEVQIERVNYFEPAFWFNNRYWHYFLRIFYLLFLVPDRHILWFLPAYVRAYRIIKKEKIQVIFTSSFTPADHLIALALKKTTGVKWVADFRDEWAASPSLTFPTLVHRWIAKILEKKVVQSADAITTVSVPLTDYFQAIFPYKDNFLTITNGFDADDFMTKQRFVKHQSCRIIYAGSLYAGRKSNLFLEAIEELQLPRLKVDFLGSKKKVNHRKATYAMLEADILLLILSPHDGPGVYTGKLFEYLAVRKPILALAPAHTAAAKLVQKLNVGEVVNPLDKNEIKEKIQKMYDLWQKGELKIPHVDIEQFNRINLTHQLAKLFDNLISPSQQKIKICVVGNSPESFHNQKFCQYLIGLGYEVHFIAAKPGQIRGVKMHYIVFDEKNFLPIWGIKSMFKIRQIIRQIQPDVVHGQYLTIGGILAYLSGFRPYVLTAWGSDILLYKELNIIERFLLKQTIRNASLLTGDSSVLLDKVIELGVKPKKYIDFIFGVDFSIFKKSSVEYLRKNLGFGNKKIIFCPRSIAPVYNIDILIRAFAIVATKDKSVKLILLEDVRDQRYFEKIKIIIRELNLAEKVIFIPKIENQHINKYYNLAEVVVSIPVSDSCSVSFLEAMACEKKILLSDLPYLKEWKKGENFWLTPVDDIQKTAQNLFKSLKYPQSKFKAIGQQNRELVRKKAEVNFNFEKLRRAYGELLDKQTAVYENSPDNFRERKIKICLIGNLQSPQNRILVKYLNQKNYEIHFITHKQAEFEGIKIYYVLQKYTDIESDSIFIFKAFLEKLSTLRKIRKIIAEIKPDIVHGQSLTFSGIWAELSGFRPLILTLWGSDVMLFESFVYPLRFLIKRALGNADIITGSSEALNIKAQKIGMNPSKFELVHFGVNLEKFKKNKADNLRKKLKLGSEKVIFCPRSIAPVYNIDILIKAFKIIAVKQNIKLIFLNQNADWKYFYKIKAMVNSLGLKDKVYFLPRIDNKDMVKYYNIADIVVSLASSDGCAMSFLEAMACQKKIVITEVPFTKEWYEKNNFWLVPIRNIKATINTIKEALDYPENKFQRISLKNRQMISERAELNKNFAKLNRLYQKLLMDGYHK